MERTSCFILWISFFTLSCSGPDQNQSQVNTAPAEQVSHMESICGSYLYPALYHLEVSLSEYRWPENLIGQPSDFFSEFLDESDKEEIHQQLREYYNNGNAAVSTNRIRKWCIAALSFENGSGRNLSTEEFLASLYDNDRYRVLFDPYRNRQVFTTSGTDPIDKIASLSSAELSDLINRWFTLLSGMPDDEFESSLNNAGLTPAVGDATP